MPVTDEGSDRTLMDIERKSGERCTHAKSRPTHQRLHSSTEGPRAQNARAEQ